MSDVDVQLRCGPLGDAVVLALDGFEAMDDLAAWEIRVLASADVDVSALLRAPATLVMIDVAEGTERLVSLIVTEATSELRRQGRRIVTLRLSDPPWVLGLRGGYRVFLEKTTEQIVTEVLSDAGVPVSAIEPRLGGAYPVRLQCVQYAESEWAFIERLLADEGISYWSETTGDGEHRLVFGDGVGSHDGLEGGALLPYVGPAGARKAGSRAFYALEWEERVVPDRVEIRDFDVRQPDLYIDGAAGEGSLVCFEYPANVPSRDAAALRAERRLEQLQRDKVTVSGETDCVRVQPGRLLEIAGAGVELFEQRMLVTGVRHRFARPQGQGGRSEPYGNRVTLKPTQGAGGEAHPPYRPAVRRGPAVEHLESAVVTGPSGEEIHVDDLGRIKLRFLWDRSGTTDDRSSHWTRCLQYPLGAAMFLPRVGWEVSIGYLDGSPDRPFVLGRLYNATAVVPYPLPAASATTSFQSWTTPKSGMTQEIKMVDDAGRPAFFVHASKDFSIKVGGSQSTKVDGDEEHSVGLSLTSNVLGSHGATIAAMQSLDVGQELLLSVEGANAETIGGAEVVKVTGNRAVIADGACFEGVAGSYALLCNQSNVKVSGVCTRVVGAVKEVTSGLGVTESVGGLRTYVCRGSRTITCGVYAESIMGGKRSKAGSVNEQAGGPVSTSASSGTIKAGTVTITAGAKVTLTAPKVTLDVAGSLLAGALKIGGGKLETLAGTTLFQGTTTTKSGGGEAGS